MSDLDKAQEELQEQITNIKNIMDIHIKYFNANKENVIHNRSYDKGINSQRQLAVDAGRGYIEGAMALKELRKEIEIK